MHDWEALRAFRNQTNRTIYLRDELRAQSEPAFLIPQRCFLEFALGSAPKNYAPSHFLRRSLSEAFALSHDTTSSGFAS